MPFLPVETWSQIILDHVPTQDLLALSTTSSFFTPIAQAALFQDVFVDYEGSTWAVPRRRSFVRFVASLELRPELGAFVHSFSIHADFTLPNSIHASPDLTLYASHFPSLSLLTQLRELCLHGLAIPANFVSTLPLLPCLVKVQLSGCIIYGYNSLQATRLNDFSKLVIWSLEYAPAEGWIAVVPTNLEHLEIDEYDEHYLGKTVDTILSAFTVRDLTRSLMTVVLRHPYNSAHLVPFLTSATQIRCLKLGIDGKHSALIDTMETLPRSAIPLLEAFEGSAELSAIIVPGRPVHTVDLYIDRSPVNILTSLQESTASVTSIGLRFSARLKPGAAFLHFMPASVEYLCFRTYSIEKEHVSALCLALSSRRNLHVVSFPQIRQRTTRESREMVYSDIVKMFPKACPSIREFVFDSERWLARRDGGWEHYFISPILSRDGARI